MILLAALVVALFYGFGRETGEGSVVSTHTVTCVMEDSEHAKHCTLREGQTVTDLVQEWMDTSHEMQYPQCPSE